MSSVQMEVRQCLGCKSTFKVMQGSRQRYHSAFCQEVATGIHMNDRSNQMKKDIDNDIKRQKENTLFPTRTAKPE